MLGVSKKKHQQPYWPYFDDCQFNNSIKTTFKFSGLA